jgi:hypothetical protein
MLEKENQAKKKKQLWSAEQEKLLASWSERASGYRWLHSRSEKKYRKCNYAFTIPVIILSTLTGTANFAMDSFVPEEYKQTAMACVGGVNIFAGILSTLQNFLRYAELMEGHRVAEVSWSKFSREISVELALDPDMRKPAFDFLTVSRAEYDRLIEQSPTIDDNIIAQYNSKFMKKKKSKGNNNLDSNNSVDGSPRSAVSDNTSHHEEIDHPHVCNGIHKCNIYERKKEDKLHENISNAAGKFMENKFNRKWGIDKIHEKNNGNPIASVKNTTSNFENKKELEGLMNIGKVKSFKNRINMDEVEDHPAKEIKKIVKAIEEEDETIVNLTSSEKERVSLDGEDVERLLDFVKEPKLHDLDLEKGVGSEETESLIPPEPDPEPEPEPDPEPEPEPDPEPEPEPYPYPEKYVKETVDEIIDDIETNTKETQTEEDNKDLVIEIKGKSESTDDDDLFKEENEIKDFLGKIE